VGRRRRLYSVTKGNRETAIFRDAVPHCIPANQRRRRPERTYARWVHGAAHVSMPPSMFALEIADMILDHGADARIADNWGHTPEMVARKWARLGTGDGFLALLSAERRARNATPELPAPAEVADWLSMLDSTHVVTGLFDDDADRDPDARSADYMKQVNRFQSRKTILLLIIERYGKSAVEYLIVNLRLASLIPRSTSYFWPRFWATMTSSLRPTKMRSKNDGGLGGANTSRTLNIPLSLGALNHLDLLGQPMLSSREISIKRRWTPMTWSG
jgi:hypothetical protein